MNWYAIYTKTKCEDAVTHNLRNAELKVINPKIRTKKFIRGKYSYVSEPLFKNYIFACFDRDKLGHMIKYTRGVRYIVGKDNPLIVPTEIIAALQERMDGDFIVSAPENLEKGDRVMIKEGPFKDFYGIFQRDIPGRERVIILLEALSIRLEIEDISVKKA